MKIILMSLFLLFLSCKLPLYSDKFHEIRYEVSGTSKKAELSMKAENGYLSRTIRDLPFVYIFFAEDGDLLHIAAQSFTANASLRVDILKEGELLIGAEQFGDSVFVSVQKEL